MYKITIEVIDHDDQSQYEKWKEIYKQIVPEIDIKEVANLVNSVYDVQLEQSLMIEKGQPDNEVQ